MMTSWSRYLACSFTRSGISTTQGPHQVAQKLTRTTLPFRLSELMVRAVDVRHRERGHVHWRAQQLDDERAVIVLVLARFNGCGLVR